MESNGEFFYDPVCVPLPLGFPFHCLNTTKRGVAHVLAVGYGQFVLGQCHWPDAGTHTHTRTQTHTHTHMSLQFGGPFHSQFESCTRSMSLGGRFIGGARVFLWSKCDAESTQMWTLQYCKSNKEGRAEQSLPVTSMAWPGNTKGVSSSMSTHGLRWPRNFRGSACRRHV